MLTSKQEHFVSLMITGVNASDAYRQAYDAKNMLPATVSNEAYVLTVNHEIATKITEGRQANRDWDYQRLLDNAGVNLSGAQADRNWSAANGALAYVGKITGLVTESHESTVHHVAEVDTDSLLAALQAIKDIKARIIDGELVNSEPEAMS
jgi:hypothetical protein